MLQIKRIEEIAQDLINRKVKIFAKEIPLAQAREINGLRAVFDEVFFFYRKILNKVISLIHICGSFFVIVIIFIIVIIIVIILF